MGVSLATMSEQISFLNTCQAAWVGHDANKASELLDQSNSLLTQLNNGQSKLSAAIMWSGYESRQGSCETGRVQPCPNSRR
jgi:hypothetical protein